MNANEPKLDFHSFVVVICAMRSSPEHPRSDVSIAYEATRILALFVKIRVHSWINFHPS
jgi:hypothetical protein